MGTPSKFYIVTLILIANRSFGFTTVSTTKIGNNSAALELILLHNNDIHGRFDESTSFRTYCTEDDIQENKCFGGFPRIATVVKEYRNAYGNGNGPPVLYVNAGDTFTGTR